jgi:tetratricopeptide (TPR) repeat protein
MTPVFIQKNHKMRRQLFLLPLLLTIFFSVSFAQTDISELYEQAKSLHSQGELADANLLLNQVLEAEPDHVNALIRRANIQLRFGNFESAEKDLSHALEVEPANVSALYNSGLVQYMKGSSGSALPFFDRAIVLDTTDYLLYRYRGECRMRDQDIEGALADYEAAHTLNPTDYKSGLTYSALLQSKRQFGPAIELLDSLAIHHPDSLDLFSMKAASEYSALRFEDAIGTFGKVISLSPKTGDFYVLRASALMEVKRYEEAIADMNMAISLSPEKADHYTMRGALYSLNEDPEAACKDFMEAEKWGATKETLAPMRKEAGCEQK